MTTSSPRWIEDDARPCAPSVTTAGDMWQLRDLIPCYRTEFDHVLAEGAHAS